MLVLSRKRDEKIETYPGPDFVQKAIDAFEKESTRAFNDPEKTEAIREFLQWMVDEGFLESKIMVVEIRGDKTRLGIEANKAFAVHREEVAVQARKGK